ncbi:hypothetical protein [Pectobacterium quasiaquaticum]|nr:hypothetical protein [Pectobacterium quasiaquaticum]
MAEILMADELRSRVDELLENGMLDLNMHKTLNSLINVREFNSVKKITDDIISNKKNNETNEKDMFVKYKKNMKEISLINERLISLSEENATLKEHQKIYNHDLERISIILKEKENKIKTLNEENKELKEKTQQSRIDKNISGYVDSVKDKLNADDSFFIKMSHLWSGCGAVFCMGAISAAFCTFIEGIDTLLKNDELNSISLFYLFTRGLLGIGLLSWLSYVCFSNSRRYTHESIRRKDRQHALMFGQIFLQIFGGTASKEDAIHVFKDWNMSGDTAFSGKTEQPPSVYGLLTQIRNMLTKKSDNVGESTKKEDDN